MTSQNFTLNKIDIEELITFSQSSSWKPSYPSSLVRRFLTELISSQEMIIDLHDSSGRKASAVLLDQVNNPSNDACLEILGMRDDLEISSFIGELVAIAKQRIPKERSGMQVVFHEGLHISNYVLEQQKLIHHYDTYEMQRTAGSEDSFNKREEITLASPTDGPMIYKVLKESFANNPDTSLTQESAWLINFLNSEKSVHYVWQEANQILGFANLIESDRASEIRTIGVLPAYRGNGIGKHLLQRCLAESAARGLKICHLSVAVKNVRALDLYLKSGFDVVEKFRCFRVLR